MLGHSLTFMSSKWKTGYLFYQLPSTFVLDGNSPSQCSNFLVNNTERKPVFSCFRILPEMQVTVLYVGVGEPTHRKGIVGQHIPIHVLKKKFAKKNHFWNTKNKKNNNRNRKWILISSKKWILILKKKKKHLKIEKIELEFQNWFEYTIKFKELLIKKAAILVRTNKNKTIGSVSDLYLSSLSHPSIDMEQ